jgi:hypothetical protein
MLSDSTRCCASATTGALVSTVASRNTSTGDTPDQLDRRISSIIKDTAEIRNAQPWFPFGLFSHVGPRIRQPALRRRKITRVQLYGGCSAVQACFQKR